MSDKPRCECIIPTYIVGVPPCMRCNDQAFYRVTDLYRPGVTRDSCAEHLSDIVDQLRAEAPGGGEYMPMLVRRIPDE